MSAKRDSAAALDVSDKMEEQIEMNNATSETLNLSREPSASGIETSRSLSGFTPSTSLQTKDTHRIDPKRWCGLCRGYVRQDWDTIIIEDGVDELRAGWIELFFDLIYVACIVHISSEVAYSLPGDDHRRRLADTSDSDHHTTYSAYDSHYECENEWGYAFLVCSFAQFGILVNAWRQQVQYITHFVFNQVVDEVIKLLFMIQILCMGIFIKPDASYHRAFLVSYGLLQLVIMLMFIKVLLIPRGKNHGKWFLGQAAVTLFIIIVILASDPVECQFGFFGIYLGLYFWETIASYSSYLVDGCFKLDPRIAIPLNVPHIAERYGLFVMLILGEAIISVMGTDLGELNLEERFVWQPDGTPPSQILVAFLILGLVLAWSIGRLYYDCQPSEEAILRGHDNHALRISAKTGRTFVYAHVLLFFGLLALGVGIKVTGKHLFDTERRWIDTVLPGYGLVAIVIALNLIRIAHPYHVHKMVWIIRGILLILMIITPLFTMQVNNGVLFCIIFGCVVGQLFVDVEGKEKIKHEKQEMKEKRELAKENSAGTPQKSAADRFKHLRRVTSGIGKM